MQHFLFVNKNSHEIIPFLEFAECRGVKISTANTMQAALAVTYCEKIDAIIADMQLPDGSGLDLLRHDSLREMTKIKVFLTGERDEPEIINELQTLGATEYFPKPFTLKQFEKIIVCVKQDNYPANQPNVIMPNDKGFGCMVGTSPVMMRLYHFIQKVAPTNAAVFIIGKSGTGKELVAQAIHQYSRRAKETYLAINCGAISSELIGSALFGHEKGSFTGAVAAHKGYFEQASGGTLFLDEITETSQDLQVKLLRVLETGKVIPVGGKRQIDVNVRIIASTNREPEWAVKEGILREDLYYRLNVFPLYLPTLKERDTDIILLARHFLELHNITEGKSVQFTDQALAMLHELPYAGNVRELKNIIYRAFILADDFIDVEHIQLNKLSQINQAE